MRWSRGFDAHKPKGQNARLAIRRSNMSALQAPIRFSIDKAVLVVVAQPWFNVLYPVYALCAMHYALCAMRYALCAMRYALCSQLAP